MPNGKPDRSIPLQILDSAIKALKARKTQAEEEARGQELKESFINEPMRAVISGFFTGATGLPSSGFGIPTAQAAPEGEPQDADRSRIAELFRGSQGATFPEALGETTRRSPLGVVTGALLGPKAQEKVGKSVETIAGQTGGFVEGVAKKTPQKGFLPAIVGEVREGIARTVPIPQLEPQEETELLSAAQEAGLPVQGKGKGFAGQIAKFLSNPKVLKVALPLGLAAFGGDTGLAAGGGLARGFAESEEAERAALAKLTEEGRKARTDLATSLITATAKVSTDELLSEEQKQATIEQITQLAQDAQGNIDLVGAKDSKQKKDPQELVETFSDKVKKLLGVRQKEKPSFATVEEAEAAGLPKGTLISVGGRDARIK